MCIGIPWDLIKMQILSIGLGRAQDVSFLTSSQVRWCCWSWATLWITTHCSFCVFVIHFPNLLHPPFLSYIRARNKLLWRFLSLWSSLAHNRLWGLRWASWDAGSLCHLTTWADPRGQTWPACRTLGLQQPRKDTECLNIMIIFSLTRWLL